MGSKTYYLALDLKSDPKLITEYEDYHKKVWPGIIQSIRDAGITNMEIYRFANRLFMVMEVDDTFSFEEKTQKDDANPAVQRWEKLMWKYQQSIPGTAPGSKWVILNKIFSLNDC